MNADQYRKALEQLELTQHDAARLLGVHTRTSENYATEATPIPGPVARLVRVVQKLGVDQVKQLWGPKP